MVEIIPATLTVPCLNGAVLMLRRRADDRAFPGTWCFPGGRIDPVGEGWEDPQVGALRELFEETGLRGEVLDTYGIFESPHLARQRIYRIHCFQVQVTSRRVQLSEEHQDFKWFTAYKDAPKSLAGRATAHLLDRIFNGG